MPNALRATFLAIVFGYYVLFAVDLGTSFAQRGAITT
jgi:hypothetical protein